MSKKPIKITQIVARIGRIERKCDRLIKEVGNLRKAITPQQSEIDEIIEHLHLTAKALREQSSIERRNYSRNAGEI